MRNSSLTAIGILAVALMISPLLLSSLPVSPVRAQGAAVFIVSGKATAYNINTQGVPPENYYTSSPPIIAAQRIGSGAVVAGGIIAGCRNGNWNNPANPSPHFDALFDVIFQWMVPGAENVLWYEGYEVYNDISGCSQLVAALEDFGYSVTGDATEPITSSLLAPYDILIIPQLQLGSLALLPDNDVRTIKSFVKGGGGLLIMEQSDFQGHQFPTIQNKVLRKLGFGYGFQDDQVEDNMNHWGGEDPENYFRVIVNVDVTTEIGVDYQAATGKTEIGLYSVCSLTVLPPPPENEVTLECPAGAKRGDPGDTLTFEVRVKNTGTKPDTYTITAEDTLGWSLSISENGFSLENDKSKKVEVEVTIPSDLVEKAGDEILVKGVGVSGVEDSVILVASACVPVEGPPYPTVQFIPGEIYFWFSVCTLRVELPAVPIMCGTETGHSMELTPREPWPMLYCVGEYPPMGAAELVGEGRVIAHSGLGVIRSLPVNQFNDERLAGKLLTPLMVQWLIDWENMESHNFKFLFYCSQGAFHNAERLYEWLELAENELGFEVDNQEGGTITPGLLADYDVLFISGLELPLSASEMQAIADWVENGGGLLLMEQADYQSESHPQNTNEVLETIGCHMRFNDDEIYDNDRYTKDGPWFPQCYLLDPREVDNEFDVWFAPNAFYIQIYRNIVRANNAKVLFSLTITNIGTKDTTYGIEVEETTPTPLGWDMEVKPAEVEVASGENTEVYIEVIIPDIDVGIDRMDLTVKVTDKGKPTLTRSDTLAAIGESVWVPPSQAKFEVGQKVSHDRWGESVVDQIVYTGGKAWAYIIIESGTGELRLAEEEELSLGGKTQVPWTIIAAVIGVVIVITIAVYWIRKK